MDDPPRDSTPPRAASRPAWVAAEYERIGAERAAASRAAERAYRWELARVCGEMLLWMVLGVVIAAFAFHVHDRDTGMIFLYAGELVNVGGVFLSLIAAYARGRRRGDW